MPQPTSKARLVITALFVDHQSPAEVAARYGVHRAWVYKLKARYEAEGETALEPRSRRPKTSPSALSTEVVDLIVRVRKELADAGLDAGPDTIAWHLQHHHGHRVSRSTISRHLTAAGLVTPEPEEAPEVLLHPVRSLDAERDLAVRLHPLPAHPPRRHRPGADVEIISWLDDCTRYALHVTRTSADHHPDRADHLPRSPRHARDPGIHADRQRHGLHRPTGRHGRRGGRNAFEDRTPPPTRRPEELPTQPPDHLRQSRTVPADDEEVATRPTRPAEPHSPSSRHSSISSPTSTTTAGRTGRCPTGRPRRPSTTRCPKPLPGPATAPRHPRPDPARPHRQGRLGHPAPQQPTAPHRHRPNPRRNLRHPARPGPPDPRRPRRHRRTPARTHPRPDTATTSPPEPPKDPPENPEMTTAGPAIAGPGCRRCLETSHWSG